ncbi:MAG TPA: hypothetical protein VIC57_01810 [Candidatus Dormibacteraeota bacterium]
MTRPRNVLGAVVLPAIAGAIAAAIAWDAAWTAAIGALVLLDAAVTAALAASGRATRMGWAVPYIVVQFDLFAAFLAVIAYVAAGRSPGVAAGLAALLLAAAAVGHARRREVFRSATAPDSWVARAAVAVPPLGFAGGVTGYAIGRGLGAFPLSVAVIMAAIAFVMVLIAHAATHRLA